MTNTYTYDASETTVTVDGRFLTGFAEGTFVEFSKDEDNFKVKVSAQGDVGVAKNNNKLGTIKVTLAQTSPDVSFLNKLANTGKMVPVWVQSSGDNKEKVGGTKAMVKKPADGKMSDEIEDREFEFQVMDYNAD